MDWHRGLGIGTSATEFAVLGPILEGSVITDLTVTGSIGAATFMVVSPTLGSVGKAEAGAHAAGVALFSEGALALNDRPAALVSTQNGVAFELRIRMHRLVLGAPRYLIVAIQNFSGAQAASVFVSARATDRVLAAGDRGGVVVSTVRRSAGGPAAGLGDFPNG